MKIFVSSFILLCFILQDSLSQFIYEMNSGVTTELTSSSNCMLTFGCGWACGINGTVVRSTTLYGQWLNVSGNGIPGNVTLDNICAIDTLFAIVSGHLGSDTWAWKTTSGGYNWFQVFYQPNGRINAVWMKNFVQGFMQGNPVGGRWSLWKTTNGGTNWDSSGLYLPQSGNESGWQNSLLVQWVSSPDTNEIWFGTNNYRIYNSMDYGRTWNIQSTTPEQNTYCISNGGQYMYAGGSNFLLKTSNEGLNWIIDTVGGTGNITGITECVWSAFLTRGDTVYTKSFFWNTWHSAYTAPAGTYKYLDNRFGGNWVYHYAVRSNGGITTFMEGEGVQKISSEIPSGFKLSQNYPNPFNPVTKIKFDIPPSKGAGGMITQLIIFDVLGKEITTLVNEQLQPGTYETEWDASNFTSGIYFYKLITAGYSETRKMVLVK